MIVGIDIETATARAGSICAIGVARIDGRSPESRVWRVRPPRNLYSPPHSRIHGLGGSDTRGQPSFGEVWPEVVRFIGKQAFVVAHNAQGCERRHLLAALGKHDLSVPRWQLSCTLSASRELHPRKRSRALEAMARHYAIDIDPHDPRSDALACAQLALCLGISRRLGEYAVDW